MEGSGAEQGIFHRGRGGGVIISVDNFVILSLFDKHFTCFNAQFYLFFIVIYYR